MQKQKDLFQHPEQWPDELTAVLEKYESEQLTYSEPETMHKENTEANARLIAAAPELLRMVYDLMQCVKRLTADDMQQFDRDTEAQWIGEAHELLHKVNPNYYKNANT